MAYVAGRAGANPHIPSTAGELFIDGELVMIVPASCPTALLALERHEPSQPKQMIEIQTEGYLGEVDGIMRDI